MKVKNSLLTLFFISFVFAFGASLLLKKIEGAPYFKDVQVLLISLYGWIPGAIALFFFRHEKRNFKLLSFSLKKIAQVTALSFLIVFLGIVFSLFFSSFSLDAMAEAAKMYHINFSSQVISASLFFMILYAFTFLSCISVNFVLTLGEEIYWRGYLPEKLQFMDQKKVITSTSFLWALWLAPLTFFLGHNYPRQPLIGFALVLLSCFFLNPILFYLKDQEKGLTSCSIFHGLIKAFFPVCVVFFPEGNHFLIAPLGVAGVLAIGVVSLFIQFQTAKKMKLLFAR